MHLESGDHPVTMSETASAVSQPDEELFRLLVGGVREYAIYMLDPHGCVLTWNAGAERLKGYTHSEIIGASFAKFFTPEDLALNAPERILADARQRGTHREEGWRLRKDGSRFWADVLVTALYSPDGALRGFAKVTRDETDRHEMQEQLRASEERFRLLVGGLKEHALYMLDTAGVVVNWNAGAQHIKQYTAEEIVGRHFGVFFTSDERASGKPQRELDLAAKLGSYEEEGWRIRKDGTRFWAAVVVTALRDDSGTIKGFAKVTRDETRRHQADVDLQQALERTMAAERELRPHAAALEKRVAERTQQLVVQQESLRALNAELESFAFIASHDLQEPLRMVSMQLDLIKHRHGKALDDQVLKSISTALEGAERMRRLIDSLLAYSRIDHLATSFDLTDANRAFSDAVLNLRATIDRTQAIVTSDTLPSLRIAHEQLTQVLQNLIGNGIKYNRGQARIGVSAQKDGEFYVIRVQDNGIGIEQHLLAEIFKPFKRLHDQNEFTGSGVGLAIVKKIIERHGGRLSVESSPGRGTCFAFALQAQ